MGLFAGILINRRWNREITFSFILKPDWESVRAILRVGIPSTLVQVLTSFVSVIMKDNYNNYTVAKGLYTMVDKANIYQYYTVFCAGSVLVAVPIVLLFTRLQKYYVAGVTGGATKG